MGKEKKKKKKVVYIDDGSTIADMSGVGGMSSRRNSQGNADKKQTYSDDLHTGNKFKDSARTYFKTVKLMIVPMLVTMAIIAAVFLIVWLLLTIAS